MIDFQPSINIAMFVAELRDCSRQPGMLRISRNACARRYLLSLQAEHQILDTEFGMTLKYGLAVCKSCPEGRIFAEDLISTRGMHLSKKPFALLRKRKGRTPNKYQEKYSG